MLAELSLTLSRACRLLSLRATNEQLQPTPKCSSRIRGLRFRGRG